MITAADEDLTEPETGQALAPSSTAGSSANTNTNAEPVLEPVKLLLVDDEPKNLTALEAVLEDLSPGLTLVSATSGPEALKHLLHEDFAVILLDVHMPLMDGFETAALVRGRERSRNTPIIFLTAALRGDAQVAKGYSLGAVDYILKPFDPDILRSKVAVFVELFRKTLQVQRQARERERLVEEQAARAAAEAAQRRFAFLAMASETLGSSLDCNATLRSLAEMCVPTLADVCIIDLATEDGGQIVRAAVAAAQSVNESIAECLRERIPSPKGTGPGIPRVIRNGQPCLLVWPRDGVDKDDPHSGALTTRDAEGRQCIRDLAPRMAIVVPLLARDRTLGSLTLISRNVKGSRPAYTDDDVTFTADLGRRAALAVDNARLYAEAQAAVRVRDEFLASATHDLKTPLTVIKAQAQLLHRRASKSSGPDSEKVRDEAARISVATTKMVGLVDQMLDVAALQMGKPLELRREPTDLVALAREGVGELHDPKGRHDLRVETDLPELVGDWDPQRLERVLGNLLSNALKYSPAGGEIVVEVRRAGSEAVLTVCDHGVGIPADELPRVFDRFYRGRNVVGRIAGTGIGLAGVRQIIEEHRGQISVESTEGQGTTITVRLPL